MLVGSDDVRRRRNGGTAHFRFPIAAVHDSRDDSHKEWSLGWE